jgi:hypothetical protein
MYIYIGKGVFAAIFRNATFRKTWGGDMWGKAWERGGLAETCLDALA